jgi:NADH-quinone oxidoreductase subunit F
MENLLLNKINKPGLQNIGAYLAEGGYKTLKKVLLSDPNEILKELKKSRLLGRSGAFPVSAKWEMARQGTSFPKYIVCDADEGEPGCFKDRLLLSRSPHLILEAMIIAGYTVGAQQGYIYIRGEYNDEIRIVEKAIAKARVEGYLGKNILNTDFCFNIGVYRGAGSYVVGEETALLRSMAGYRPSPDARPPYPVQKGFMGKPTVINNVETLANIPDIVKNGGDWYADIGNPEYPGTKLFCLSGNVKKPGIYELPFGITLRELIYKYGGGIKGKFKAVLPGGIASGFVTDLDVKLDYKSLIKVNSLMGPGAVIVINNKLNSIDISLNILEFFARESCGKCSVCREGIRTALIIMNRFANYKAGNDDIKLLFMLRKLMYDAANCVLGQAALNTTVSAIKLFMDEFELRVRG